MDLPAISSNLRASDCLPFFHPTRVAFVDDQHRAMVYIAQAVALACPISFFTSGEALLAAIDEERLEVGLSLPCLSDVSGTLFDADMEQHVSLDKTMLFKQSFKPDRFDTVGVIIIDYAMPGKDGLEICRELDAHAARYGYTPARRIMLTGEADDAVGLDALNARLIDAFYRKTRRELAPALRKQVGELQRAFMADATSAVRGLLSRSHNLFADAEFAPWLDLFREQHGFVEYYAVFEPTPGFLLFDANGTASLLLVFSDRLLDSQLASARTSRAPRLVLDSLEKRRFGLHFSDEQGQQRLSHQAWCDSCVPLRPFAHRHDCYYALLDHCRPYDLLPGSVQSLNAALVRARG